MKVIVKLQLQPSLAVANGSGESFGMLDLVCTGYMLGTACRSPRSPARVGVSRAAGTARPSRAERYLARAWPVNFF